MENATPTRRSGADPAVAHAAARVERGAIAIAVALPALFALVSVAQPWADAGQLWRDPLAAAAAQVGRAGGDATDCCGRHLGVFSQLGLIVWSAAIGAALLIVAQALRDDRWRDARFGASAAALTLLLCLDEALMIHEFADDRLRFGEEAVLAALAVWLAAHLLVFRGVILGPRTLLLAATLGLFAVSTFIDLFVPQTAPVVVLEDALKLAGIGLWLLLHVLIGLDLTDPSRKSGAAR